MSDGEDREDRQSGAPDEPATIAAQVVPRHVAHGRRAALVGLVALLVCVLGAVVGATAYLLRNSVSAATTAAPPPIRPFNLFYVQRGVLWVRAGGASHSITALPPEAVAGKGRLVLAPNGARALVLGQTRAWLVAPGGTPQPLSLPSTPSGARAWHCLDATWTGPHSFAILLVRSAADGAQGMIARYNADGMRTALQALRLQTGQPISLSPDGSQVAVLDALGGHDAFATQYAVELRDAGAHHRSVAYQYVGGQPVDAVAWSPDRGTVVVDVPNGGVAIQKSSGRPVLHAARGAFPVAFSDPTHARLAYIVADHGRLQIHVLALHGERDTSLDPPVQQAPSALAWTPDARAILYATGTAIWQVAIDSGQATRLVAGTAIEQIGAARASAPLAR